MKTTFSLRIWNFGPFSFDFSEKCYNMPLILLCKFAAQSKNFVSTIGIDCSLYYNHPGFVPKISNNTVLRKYTIDPHCWNEILTLLGKFTQQNKWHVMTFLWEIKGKWTKVSYSERKSHFHSPVFDWLFKEFIICPFKIANIFPLSLWNDVVFLSR